jgi:hypothetical protein
MASSSITTAASEIEALVKFMSLMTLMETMYVSMIIILSLSSLSYFPPNI